MGPSGDAGGWAPGGEVTGLLHGDTEPMDAAGALAIGEEELVRRETARHDGWPGIGRDGGGVGEEFEEITHAVLIGIIGGIAVR